MKKAAKKAAFFQAVEKGEKLYFPKLIARFPWARAQASSVASKPLCSHICKQMRRK